MSLRNLKGRYRWFTVTALCSLLALPAFTAELSLNIPGYDNFRADTSLVAVPVNVLDSMISVVNHLDPKAFRVFEDGIEQQIVAVGADDTPASIGFVFDTSLSMGAKLDLSRQAVAAFLRSANPADEFFLLPFESRPGALIGFTSRPDEIVAQLAQAKSGGTTAMLDAIQSAFLNIRKAHNARRAIVIVSDGGDNHSRATKADIRRMAREADAQVYALGTYEPPSIRRRSAEESTGPGLLTEISEQTGGRSFPVRNASDIMDAAIRIGFELRNQYLIRLSAFQSELERGISPDHSGCGAASGLPQLRAYWRQGYYAVQPGLERTYPRT